MTRKDFRLIAETIADLDLHPSDTVKVARAFAKALRSTNSAFDAERFIDACRVHADA